MSKISVTILTKNSAKTLKETLDSLCHFDEVLIYDTGSSDETLEIAKAFPNVRIERGVFEGFGKTHNRASSLAKNSWILSIDSDEVLSLELEKEILSLTLDKGSVYSFPRQNFYRGKWIKGAGWWPDRVVRLYFKESSSFTEDAVHERVKREGLKHHFLKHPCRHIPYREVSDFLNKMQIYGDLFAKEHVGKKSASFSKALVRGFFAFFKAYILMRGIFDGKEGFEIAVYQGNSCFYKYLKLLERTRRCPDEKGSLLSSSIETKRKGAGASSIEVS